MTVDPFRELLELQRGINSLFHDKVAKAPPGEVALSSWTPAADVYEDDEAFTIKLELPEVSRNDVKVNLNENVLLVSGERHLENEEKREGYHRVERSYGQFFRSFSLPPNANADSISADFKEGVLRVRVPKKDEARPRQIDVKVG